MQALVLERYKTTPKLREVASPVPGPGDLLVDVHAASVNPVDMKIRDGGIKILAKYKPPIVLGNDASGVVVKVGPGVTRFSVGDEVYARVDRNRMGCFADQVLMRESEAALKPKNMTHVEAASIPLVGLTSWQGLVELAAVQKGQSVLIHAGSGGLGTFAIQLAHHLGARVTTTVSARNEALVRGLGADEVVDYRSTPFETVVRDVDVVLDTQGGDTLMRSFKVVKPGGIIVSVSGVPDGKFGRSYGLNALLVALLSAMTWKVARASKRGKVRFEWFFMRSSGEQLSSIATLIEAGKIKPVVDRVFPLSQVLEAFAYSETGRATGKVVVQVKP